MNRKITTLALPLILTATAGLAGCASFNAIFMPAGDDGLDRVDGMVSRVERVHVECEESREKFTTAFGLLNTFVAPDFSGDAVRAYDDFIAAIEASEDQADDLRSRFEKMRQEAEPFFEQWMVDLRNFANPGMRNRSQQRLTATRESYEAIVTAVRPTITAFDAFNLTLRDHALFLGHDFNAASVSALEGEVDALGELAVELDDRFADSLEAARAYIESFAFPLRVELTSDGAREPTE